MTRRSSTSPVSSSPASHRLRHARRAAGPNASARAPRAVDPVLEKRVQQCVDGRRGRPERFPAALIALMLVSFAAEADPEDEAWSAPWFQVFFGRWMPARAMFPVALAPHIVEVVIEILEELVEEGTVSDEHREVLRADPEHWSRELAAAMERARAHLV